MGLFNFFKNKTVETKMPKCLNLIDFDSFDYSINIQDSTPKLKIKPYDEEISLILYLKTIKFSNDDLKSIKKNNEYNDIKKIIQNKNSTMTYFTSSNHDLLNKLLKVCIIKNYFNDIIEMLSYILSYELVLYFGTDEIKRNENEYLINEYTQRILELHKSDDSTQFPLLFSKELSSCLAYYQLKSDKDINGIYHDVLKTIENIYHTDTSINTCIRYLSGSYVQKILTYNFEEVFNKPLSISFLLKDKNKIDTSNFNANIFDIRKMTQYEYDPDYYIIPKEYQEKCIKDILFLNEYIIKASSIAKKVLTVISENNLQFDSNSFDCCKLKYTPLTKTGKASKFPFALWFADSYIDKRGMNNTDVLGTLYYSADGSIGKAEFTTWNKRVGCTIALAIKDNGLDINRIFLINENERTMIYKK